MRVRTFTIREQRGLVFLWWGEQTPPKDLPWFDDFNDTELTYAEIQVESPVGFCRLMESNLDFAHFPFVHRNYFTAKPKLVFAKNFRTEVRGQTIDMSGIFSEDTPTGRVDESGMSFRCSILFPGMALYPSPLDVKADPIVVCLAPVTEDKTWVILRSYVTPGPLVGLRRQLRERVILGLAWRHWVYHQDQRMIRGQNPAHGGMGADLLVCPSDRGIARYLQMYQRALEPVRQRGREDTSAIGVQPPSLAKDVGEASH
jgi:phenylpropionate dioxygenase-like ring-hydroxylating dioxygenase large terminal subunit